jgi:hypothetical protein
MIDAPATHRYPPLPQGWRGIADAGKQLEHEISRAIPAPVFRACRKFRVIPRIIKNS